ncbi:GTPase IMAP family member 9-like [Littorina saxatilis]|uniref:GTPase IMAP family member 9-like n=1 Tax=Littorina saxatilis TaxID=31220 RepID=UPI0038B5D573
MEFPTEVDSSAMEFPTEVDSSAMEFPTEVDSSAMEFPTEMDSSAMEFPTEVDFRFIMLGRTGSGKSSTANTIFGQEVFPATLSFSSVTTECQLQTISKDGVSLQILDCPGLFDTGMTNEEVSGLVMKAVSTLDDGPDAVLYVIKIGKYTEEEFSVFNMLKALLDENVTRYLVIVFTHGDVIKGGDFDVILRRTPPTLQQVIEECGSRYVVFDNTAQDKTKQVDRLFQIVRRMKTENGGRPYRCPKYAEQLIEMDDELERRLAKVEQERQKKKRYVQQLRAELAQAERSLAEQREELKKKEEERKKDAQLLMQTMHQNVEKMSETLQADQKGKQDMEGELEALKEQAEKQKQHLHEKTEEEFRMFEEKLREKKNESERLAMQLREQGDSMERIMQAQMKEYSHLKTSVARSRKRRQKNCCVM